MSSLNFVFLILNIIICLGLLRSAYKVVNKDYAKFFSIASTIRYWRDKLNSGDKFVIFPTEFKNFTDANDSFLQFKIHKKHKRKIVDLVYPIKNPIQNAKTSEFNSLVDFFGLKKSKYHDDANDIDFYFIEINPDNTDHILLLSSLSMKQRNIDLTTTIKIEIIPKNESSSSDRFLP